MKRSLALLLLVALLATACTQAPPATPAYVLVSPLDAATSPLVSPLDGAGPSTSSAPLTIPTPAADQTSITGVLMLDRKSPKPVGGVIVALAEIIPNPANAPAMAVYDRATAPKTQTDDAGRFVFRDVPVRPYALVLDRISAEYMLSDPLTGKDMLFKPQAGKILDAGKLVYDALPEQKSVP